MANWQMNNIQSGTPERPKYNAVGTTTEIWSVAVTTALANNDILLGPTIPAGCALSNVKVGTDKLDNGTAIVFRVGNAANTAAYIAAGATTAQAGGIASLNVAASLGLIETVDRQVILTTNATATTPVAGTVRIEVSYVASP
jgi:hypothetical protein